MAESSMRACSQACRSCCRLIAVAVIAAGATTLLPTLATADTDASFQSPSGNIACVGSVDGNGVGTVACDIAEHSWSAPPVPADCQLGWGDRFALNQGAAPVMRCHGDTLRAPGLPVLDYGQRKSYGAISCDSEPTGMTCTDSTTGDFFAMARATYRLHGA